MSNEPDAVDLRVGARIRLRRQLIGMSQEALGEKIGVTFQQVQKYERGANRVSASRLNNVANALGVTISYFFEGVEGAAELSREADDLINAFLSSREGIALAAAWVGIESPHIRRSILDLVRAVTSRDDGGEGSDDGE